MRKTDPFDLLYQGWTVIANVSEGNWSKQTEEWQEAATRWRDAFHAALDAHKRQYVMESYDNGCYYCRSGRCEEH